MKKKLLLLSLGLGALIIPLVVLLFFSGEDVQARSLALLVPLRLEAKQSQAVPPSTTPTQTVERSPSRTPFQPATYTPIPSFTPTPTRTPSLTLTPTSTSTPTLPAEASIEGLSGRWPAYSLDCESRSAVDWAAYFGLAIDELAFFNALPSSDNPERGFVGNVHGAWGQIPPQDYGVHAKPVAKLLRQYGAHAQAVRDMTWRDLQAEIAAGEPVIAWVIGRVNLGTPVPYTTSDGQTTTVARFQHTVIVFGYSEHKVSVLDGNQVYRRRRGDFLDSWSVLGNQAVIWDE